LTFKDLKKRVVSETEEQQKQSRLFEGLQNKPFWIWDVEEHKQEDIKTNGDCCFNHIIGLPEKNGLSLSLAATIEEASNCSERVFSNGEIMSLSG
jgi:hypothetical protein